MRAIDYHKINLHNDLIDVCAMDEPGHGGANHVYQVNPGAAVGVHLAEIKFQNGTVPEVGVNGVTHEVLLAIVIDRLRSFQSGEFSCRENALALTKCEEALLWLQKRTNDRVSRGVEGRHVA